eukprot:gene1679-1833_t
MSIAGMDLQSMYIIPPRDGSNPRIARLDESQGTRRSSDGVYYKMIDRRDWGKYHVLSDEEMANEVRRSQEVKRNLLTLSHQTPSTSISNSASTSLTKSKGQGKVGGIKTVAPQFGMSSSRRRIEQKQWQKDVTLASQGGGILSQPRPQDDDREEDYTYHNTLRQLQKNTKTLSQDRQEEGEEGKGEEGGELCDLSEMPQEGEKVKQVFHVIKKKFEQNLHVIDKLFDEKVSLEEYTQSLERKLMEVTGRSIEELEIENHPPSYHDMREESSSQLPKQLDNNKEYIEDSRATKSQSQMMTRKAIKQDDTDGINDDRSERMMHRHDHTRGDALSAEDAAAELWNHDPPPPRLQAASEEDLDFTHANRGRSRRRTSDSPANHNNSLSLRSRSLGRSQRSREDSSVDSSRRSLSLSQRGISPHLQKDIDRYVMKRRQYDEQERWMKFQAEEEEKLRRERFLKASIKGQGFKEMEERQRIMAEEKAQKLIAMKKAEEDKELEERKLRQEKKKRDNLQMAAALQASSTWQELQELESAKRRERIEARKQELMTMSALPAALVESQQRAKRTPRAVVTEEFDFRPHIRAEDPDIVGRRLAKQQQAWDQRLMQTKEKLREQYMQRSQSASRISTSSDKSKMERRAEDCKARRDARLQAQYEKEMSQRRLQERQEQEKRERLLGTKLPDSSLKATKAAKMREEKVKNELLGRELEEQREKRLREKQQSRLREAATVLKSVLKERDDELRARNPNARIEVSLAEHEAAARAAAAREEYRAKLRENKQRLRESLKNRPSLLERHDQAIANKTAATEALKTLTEVITRKDDDDIDDLEAMLEQKSKANARKESGKSAANATMDVLLEGNDVFDTKEKVIVKNILGRD